MRYSEPELTIDADTRAAVVATLCERLRAIYVFPDVGARMAEHHARRLAAGAYDECATAEALCTALTEDMHELSHDLHLRVRYSAQSRPLIEQDQLFDNPEFVEEYRRAAAFENYGYRRVERLPGNVGYIEQVALHDAVVATEAATHAFNLIANTDALILDLRANGGGDPRHVAVICTYLTEPKPIHLNSFYTREDDKLEQFWTLPYVPGPRYLAKPVWVLTSSKTFSGAEELSYNLKNLERATLVGETTGGGAHPVDMFQLDPHFTVSIAIARAINPISGTNWEGTGVAPHLPASAAEAYDVAYQLALQAVIERAEHYPPTLRARAEHEAREALEQAKSQPSPIPT